MVGLESTRAIRKMRPLQHSLEMSPTEVGRIPPADAALPAAEESLERVPEFGTEYRVDDRVEGRVEVAQPEEERDHVRIEVAGFADREKDRHYEER